LASGHLSAYAGPPRASSFSTATGDTAVKVEEGSLPPQGCTACTPGPPVEEAFPGVGGKATMDRIVSMNMMYDHQVRCDCVNIPRSGESKVGDKDDISVPQLTSPIFDNSSRRCHARIKQQLKGLVKSSAGMHNLLIKLCTKHTKRSK